MSWSVWKTRTTIFTLVTSLSNCIRTIWLPRRLGLIGCFRLSGFNHYSRLAVLPATLRPCALRTSIGGKLPSLFARQFYNILFILAINLSAESDLPPKLTSFYTHLFYLAYHKCGNNSQLLHNSSCFEWQWLNSLSPPVVNRKGDIHLPYSQLRTSYFVNEIFCSILLL